MAVHRFRLPFGKLPSKRDNGDEQWLDYCAVTDVNSDNPNEIVLVDMNLTGLSLANVISDPDISIASIAMQATFGIVPTDEVGLPAYYLERQAEEV